ncbi:ubiquitin ligase (cullin) of SCF [Kalmusia sp. IMI 367209]|nr:ubiquitin ligase (cullin) of SCF [Kalmusia sp. IMI 367209]
MVDPQKGLGRKTTFQLYQAILNYCTSEKSNARDLYQHLVDYLEDHLKKVHGKLEEHVGESLLTDYIDEWERYSSAAQRINTIFRHVNQSYLRREIHEGNQEVFYVYEFHLERWKKVMLINNRIKDTILDLIEKQRNGEEINQSHIKSVIDSFVLLGVYEEHFKKPFLDATGRYYADKAEQSSEGCNVLDYFKYVLDEPDQEGKQCQKTLFTKSIKDLDTTSSEDGDDKGWTLLSLAAGHGLETVVELLFKNQTISADRKDQEGRTPLSLASENGHKEVVRLLLENRSAKPDVTDNKGRTPLSWASGKGHEAVVELLLREFANPNLCDLQERTPLHYAVQGMHTNVVQKLIEGNANPIPNGKEIANLERIEEIRRLRSSMEDGYGSRVYKHSVSYSVPTEIHDIGGERLDLNDTDLSGMNSETVTVKSNYTRALLIHCWEVGQKLLRPRLRPGYRRLQWRV